MAGNNRQRLQRLGQSAEIKISGTRFSSREISNLMQQTKEVHTLTGLENAPRDINKKPISRSNAIKTDQVKTLTEKTIVTSSASVKTVKNKGTEQSNAVINSAKTKVSESKNTVRDSQTKQETQKKIQRQSVISTTPQTVISRPKIKTGYHISRLDNRGLGRDIKNKVQGALEQQDDAGTSTLSTAISATSVTVKTVKSAQKVTPTIQRVAVGSYEAGRKSIKVVKRVDTFVSHVQSGAIKLNRDTVIGLKNLAVRQLKGTQIVHAVESVANTVKKYTIKVGHGIQRTAVLARGIHLGTVKVQVNRETIKQIRSIAGRGSKMARATVGYTLKTSVKTSVKTGRGIAKGIYHGINGAGDMLLQTNDLGMQSLGMGLKASHYSIKGIKNAPKVAKSAVKGIKTSASVMVKTGKTVKKTYYGIKTGINTIKKTGARKTVKKWGKNAVKAIAKAGKAVVNTVGSFLKLLGKKIIVPLIVIIVVFMFLISIINNMGVSVSAIFSPFFSDDEGNEVNETEWLTANITNKRSEFIDEIKEVYNENLVENGGEYHEVRFFNAFNDAELELTETNISTSIYTITEYLQYVQPIFHTIVLSDYEMEISESQMKDLLDEIWDTINEIVIEELPTEYCKMVKTDNTDGTYTITPIKEIDGNIHADIVLCPNYTGIFKHEDSTATGLCECDYWYYICDGHRGDVNCGNNEHTHISTCYSHAGGSLTLICGKAEHTHTEGCYATDYHTGQLSYNCGNATQHKYCNGYYVCEGHEILSLTVELGSFDDLLDKYFRDEINALQSKGNLSDDEKKRLRDLEDYYEICINYIMILAEEFDYGYGEGVIVDLDGVTLTTLTDFACQFVGKPYVWGGNDPNIGADCSGFVKYVYAHFGVTLPRTARQQVTCGTSVTSIAQAQPGDLIFWSETGTDSGVYHVAIYLGNGKIVHASNSKPYPQGGIKISNVYGTVYKIKRIAR